MSVILTDLSKSYADKLVLNRFSFEFSDKGIYVLKGESGAGKTTLLRIISGLDKNFTGIKSGSFKKCSMMFQEYRLFPQLNAIDNIVLLMTKKRSAENEENAIAMLRDLNFTDEEMRLYPKELSGGMKQRVSLARALLADGDVLLLDEPTKELDSALCERINSLIKAEGERRTVILVTHRPEDIAALEATVVEIPTLH